MLPEERHQFISRVVQSEGAATVKILAKRLNVSAATIRNDLTYMERKGLLVRTHGGAIAPNFGKAREAPMWQRREMLATEKAFIGKTAAMLVEEGETLFMDASSTALSMASFIPQDRKMTVVTNSLLVMVELSTRANVTIVDTGGLFGSGSLANFGSEAEEAIYRYRVDRAFISPRGLELSAGVTDNSLDASRMHRAMIACAERTVVLCDHSKIGTVHFSKAGSLEQIHTLVCDRQPPQPYAQALSDLGIAIYDSDESEEVLVSG
jgi:DeoR/GlpR family transcriptional regulator of sugar metabolism